jgi:hypothetical protein
MGELAMIAKSLATVLGIGLWCFADATQVADSAPSDTAIRGGDVVVVSRSGAPLSVGDQVVATLPAGTRVEVSQLQGDWIGAQVSYSSSPRSGWLPTSDVKKSPVGLPDDPLVIAALKRLGATVEADSEGRVKKVTLDGLEKFDTGLAWVKCLGNLKCLHCSRTALGDADLQKLGVVPRLEVLDLRATKVSDSGLKHIARLTGLKELWLSDTAVTDSGLAQLRLLARLSTLDLGDTKVTDAGVDKLQQALPNCRIER